MDAAIAEHIISLSLRKQLVLNLHWSRSESGKLYWYHLCWHTSTSLETLPGYPQIGAFGPRGERPAVPGVPRGALGLWGGIISRPHTAGGFQPPKILTPPREHSIQSPPNPSAPYRYLYITTIKSALVSSQHPAIHIFTQLHFHHQRHGHVRDEQRLCVALLGTRHLLVLRLWGSNTTLLTWAAAKRSGKQRSACSLGNRGLLKKPHAATFFLYQHIPIGFVVVLLIVILGLILSLPRSGKPSSGPLEAAGEAAGALCRAAASGCCAGGRRRWGVRRAGQVQQDTCESSTWTFTNWAK